MIEPYLNQGPWQRQYAATLYGPMLGVAVMTGAPNPDARRWRRAVDDAAVEQYRQARDAAGPDDRRGFITVMPGGGGAESSARVGRNDPCPCGSGRKSKLCCGRPGGRV